MTKKEMLNLVKGKIESKGLVWLGRKTKRFTENLNIVFISLDMETMRSPVRALLDSYGLSGFFSRMENSDVALVGISREKMCSASLSSDVATIPTEILNIIDPDKEVRYKSVTLWGTLEGDCTSLTSPVNFVSSYDDFIVDRYKSGTLSKADMMHLVVLHKTFRNAVLEDEAFLKGVSKNPFAFWNIKKMMDYFNQKMVELFNTLSQE